MSHQVLVIEDDAAVRRGVVDALRSEGYATLEAATGKAGLAMGLECECDLVLLDLVLPGGDGMDILRQIRGTRPTLPVILLTAQTSEADHILGLDSGANDYLTKPFAFEELLARVRALLRKSPGQAATTLTVGDLELDLLAHKASRSGKELTLSSKEFALLEFMARKAGTVVTRTMISEHVWDINFDTDTNVIDVYINYLRKKIDSGAREKLIHTIRGKGYILKP